MPKKEPRLTLNAVTKAIRALGYRNVEFVRGNGYFYFSGGIANRFFESGLYGTPYLRGWTLKGIIKEFKDRVKKGKGGIK